MDIVSRHQLLDVVDTELQVIDILKEGEEGQYQAINLFEADSNLLMLTVIEGTEGPQSSQSVCIQCRCP